MVGHPSQQWDGGKTLDEEYCIDDNAEAVTFDTICGCINFEQTWTWKDPSSARLAVEQLGLVVSFHCLAVAQQLRDPVHLDRGAFNTTVVEERGASLRWGLKKLVMGPRTRTIRFIDDRHQHGVQSAK